MSGVLTGEALVLHESRRAAPLLRGSFRVLLLDTPFVCLFLGLYQQLMEVPRLGVKSELHLPAYATARWDPSSICDLYHSSWQRQIPNPCSEARDRTHILMDSSQIHFCCTTGGTP